MRNTVVYIAGPYRAKTEWEVVGNIRRAEAVALAAWKLGAAAICPHKNTLGFGGAAEDTVWLQGDLVMLRRCDAVVCVEGWERSIGAAAEVKLARELGLPVFTPPDGLRELETWLSSRE